MPNTAAPSVEAREMLLKFELDRRHDELTPNLDITFRWTRNTRTDRLNQFADVTNLGTRGYRGEPVFLHGGSSESSGLSFSVMPGETVSIYITEERERPPEALIIFMDAMDGCPCDRDRPPNRHFEHRLAIPPQTGLRAYMNAYQEENST
jgi:hypothetical protein